MRIKPAVTFANIVMAKIENQILENSKVKPLELVRFIDDIASFWDATKDVVKQFVQKPRNSTRLLNLNKWEMRIPCRQNDKKVQTCIAPIVSKLFCCLKLLHELKTQDLKNTNL